MERALINKVHLWLGVVGMVLFLLSGQYFAQAMNGLQDLDDTPRLLLRTSHAYFFFACFINIVFGLYYKAPAKLAWYVLYNQSLVMLSPLLLAYGFVFESFSNSGIERDIGTLGVVCLFVWLLNTLLGHLIAWIKAR